MIKSELIEHIAARMTHLTEKQVADGINRILELMSDALINNQRIEIRGFGSFSLHYRPPRNAHNPKKPSSDGIHLGTGSSLKMLLKDRCHEINLCSVIIFLERATLFLGVSRICVNICLFNKATSEGR